METVFEDEGRSWFRNVFTDSDVNILLGASNINSAVGMRMKVSMMPSTILKKIDEIAQNIIPSARAVRVTYFNKTSDINWALPWHQDRVIAVNRKIDIPGFNNWSQKSGTWYCEPPIEILEKMICARVHLDDSHEMNGCLEIIAGSHKYGKVLSGDIDEIVSGLKSETCIAKKGDILFTKALTLHRSKASESRLSRQALRIDYSNEDLPNPLKWALV